MEIIIVLGCRNIEIMKKRVDRAVEYFNSSPAQKIINDKAVRVKTMIFTGGGTDISEAEIMKEYANIDEKYVILESHAMNTYENLIYTKQIIDSQYGKLGQVHPNIVICTSSFHLRRVIIMALLLFKNYNVQFIHTNEDINLEDKTREMVALNKFIDQYTTSIDLY
jgi:uncharacterized SAM-binding protein YcdF (DUF218 family)